MRRGGGKRREGLGRSVSGEEGVGVSGRKVMRHLW